MSMASDIHDLPKFEDYPYDPKVNPKTARGLRKIQAIEYEPTRRIAFDMYMEHFHKAYRSTHVDGKRRGAGEL